MDQVLDLIWCVPGLPFLGFLLLLLGGGFLSRLQVIILGITPILLSAFITLMIACHFLNNPPLSGSFVQTLWSWMSVGDFRPTFGLHLDSLSLLMIFVVTFVGTLIAIYSSEFMEDYGEERRFYSCLNLFIANMLMLVLADNMLLMYLGWEGVGLCSYMLIGFWYKEAKNGVSARKAFIVTRVGDTAFAVGLFLLFTHLKTLNIVEAIQLAATKWPLLESGSASSSTIFWICVLLLGGACGKSAQLPLQTWLPDAMVGPTPASALIHAATMVTAGVYLIARTNGLFYLAPQAQIIVAIVGTLTLLIAGVSAWNQRDIKRVLAYSTVSQIGYMFLGLGVGAYRASMFHFMTHAFFKALLFLGAGVIGHCLHHEYDMFKMGGLKKQLPVVFWTFLLGSCSLAALPLVTAGFYSKDMILAEAYASKLGGTWFWMCGILGAFITATYTFRMIFIAFYGEPREHDHLEHHPGWRMSIPLVILAILAIVSGLVETPHTLGHITFFSKQLQSVLPATPYLSELTLSQEIFVQSVAVIVTLLGLFLAYQLYYKRKLEKPYAQTDGTWAPLCRLWMQGWGFDDFYNIVFVRPYVWFSQINHADFFNVFYQGMADLVVSAHELCKQMQTGHFRTYAAFVAFGAILFLSLLVVT